MNCLITWADGQRKGGYVSTNHPLSKKHKLKPGRNRSWEVYCSESLQTSNVQGKNSVEEEIFLFFLRTMIVS